MNRPYRWFFSISAAATLIAAPLLAGRDSGEGSLWRQGAARGERSMFADKRAQRLGDIVTIIVGENSSMATSVKLSTNRNSNIANDFSRVLFTDILRRQGETPATDISIGPNSHEGGGHVDNSSRLSARISVHVIDTLPNGNLVLEGVRVISYSGETFYMLTQGVCRTHDVNSDNTIHSSEIADARLEIVAEGSLTEAQKEGWLTRIANRYSP